MRSSRFMICEGRIQSKISCNSISTPTLDYKLNRAMAHAATIFTVHIQSCRIRRSQLLWVWKLPSQLPAHDCTPLFAYMYTLTPDTFHIDFIQSDAVCYWHSKYRYRNERWRREEDRKQSPVAHLWRGNESLILNLEGLPR